MVILFFSATIFCNKKRSLQSGIACPQKCVIYLILRGILIADRDIELDRDIDCSFVLIRLPQQESAVEKIGSFIKK